MNTTVHRLFVLLAITAAPLGAQEEARDTTLLRPMVITATREPLAQVAITAATTTITGEELRIRGVASVAEALRLVPGAAIAPSGSFGGTTSLFLRGGERDYVRVLVDGVPINQPGGEVDLAHLTTDNIERIEVVRGPTSVLYGSDAVTGVVQIFTRTGGGPPALTAAARGGGYGAREMDLSATGGGDRTAWSVAAAGRRSDGILPFNNQYRNDLFSGSLMITPEPRTAARLTTRFNDSRFNYPTDETGQPVDSNAFRTERQLVLGVDASRQLTSGLQARLLLGATEADLRTDDRPDNEEDGSGYISRNQVGRRSADARLVARIAPAAVIAAGFEYSQQRDRNESVSIFNGEEFPVPVQTPRRFNRALYLQATGDAAQRLSYSAGARHDRNANFGEFLTFRLAAGVRVLETTTLRATVGTAFKEPTIFENYGGGFVVGNPDLDPERSRSWEIGVEQRFLAGAASVSATWFDQRFRDKIEFASLEDVFTYANLATARATGLEIEGRVRPRRDLAVTATYSALSARVTGDDGPRGERLLRRPSTLAALAVEFHPSERGSVGVTINRVGARDDLDFAAWPAERIELPAYEKVDLAGELRVLNASAGARAVSLTARVENLLDTEYESVYGFRTPGRSLLLGARLLLSR